MSQRHRLRSGCRVKALTRRPSEAQGPRSSVATGANRLAGYSAMGPRRSPGASSRQRSSSSVGGRCSGGPRCRTSVSRCTVSSAYLQHTPPSVRSYQGSLGYPACFPDDTSHDPLCHPRCSQEVPCTSPGQPVSSHNGHMMASCFRCRHRAARHCARCSRVQANQHSTDAQSTSRVALTGGRSPPPAPQPADAASPPAARPGAAPTPPPPPPWPAAPRPCSSRPALPPGHAWVKG